jgi:hypothetical protein
MARRSSSVPIVGALQPCGAYQLPADRHDWLPESAQAPLALPFLPKVIALLTNIPSASTVSGGLNCETSNTVKAYRGK